MKEKIKSPFTGGEVIRKVENVEYTYRGVKVEAPTVYYQCVDTKEEFTDKELDEFNLNVIHNEYRIKVNIPLVEDIKNIRIKYGLSASKMSEILGLGVNTYRNYENGEMPSVANGRNIAMCENPRYFKCYVEKQPNLDKEEKDRIISTVDECIAKINTNTYVYKEFEKKIYKWSAPDINSGYTKLAIDKAKEIAYYFASLMRPFTTKLNKLLFYADFYHYAMYGKSITGLNYVAIQKGPVPNMYDTLYDQSDLIDKVSIEYPNGSSGYQFIAKDNHDFDKSLFTKEELETIKKVGDMFLVTSTGDIVELSHLEPAWIDNIEEKSMIPYSYALTLEGINNRENTV